MKLLFLLVGSLLFSQSISHIKLSDQIYMIKGKGGNIGLFVGKNDLFMVDNQYADISTRLMEQIRTISDKPIKYIVNTHFHGDHTGGNENFGKKGAIFIAHENVRKKLSVPHEVKFFGMTSDAKPQIALPKITFSDRLTLYMDQEEIELIHLKNAHTDGDAIVYFKTSNVLHMGDLYFSGMYPFFDNGNGANIKGIIYTLANVLTMINEDTRIIPGHGKESNKKELFAYLEMIKTLVSSIEKEIALKKSLSDIQSLNLAKTFESSFGNGFLKSKDIVMLIYENLIAFK